MKKRKIVLIALIILMMPSMVRAAVLTASTCSTDAYRVQRLREGNSYSSHVVPIPTNSNYSGGFYNMYTYDTYNSNGTLAGQTYCLSPGKQGTGGFGRTGGVATYYCETKIDPYSNRPYDIAITKAYQLFIDKYGATSDMSRAVGEIVFRYLGFYYNAGDRGNNSGNEGADHLAHFTLENGNFSSLWKDSEYISSAKEIFNEAVRVGNMAASGATFEQLVNQGYIWSPKWEYSISSRTQTGNQVILTISLRNTGNTPQKIQWDAFSATCENGYQCTYEMTDAPSGPGSVGGKQMRITIDTSSGKGDYGLKIHTAYYDPRSSNANMMILASANDIGKGKNFGSYYNQRFLVIANDVGIYSNNEPTWDRQEIVIKDDSCDCHYDDHGVWDGYVLTYYQKSITSTTSSYTGTTSASSLLSNQKFVKKNDLNETDRNNFKCTTCPPSSPNICNKQFTDRNQWVCGDHNGDGNGELCKDVLENGNTIEQQWQKDCDEPLEGYQTCTCNANTGFYEFNKYDGNGNVTLHQTWQYGSTAPSGVDTTKCPNTCGSPKEVCKKPSESSDGNYHCKNGEECDPDDYYRDCECGELEDYCTEHPDDPICDEYYDKCINCNPVVTIPSDCADLQEYNVNIYAGNYVGGISDISKKNTECNNNKSNMVKSCVIGKNDANNQSFEDTTIDSTKNNPYCKVWCEESYDFGLPVAKRTQSGSYFTLSTSVKGTRTCYTSAADDSTKPIDEEKFRADLEAARKAIIDAYNEYSKWDAAAKTAKETIDRGEHTPAPSECCKNMDTNDDGIPDTCDPTTACTGTDSTTDLIYNYTWTYQSYDYNGKESSLPGTASSGTEGKCDSCCDGGTCIDGVRGTPQYNTFRTNASNALNTLNDKIENFENIIAQYNSCSGNMAGNNNGWENDMQFDPEITFSYNENYLNNNENAGKFVQTDISQDKTTSTYCTTDTGRTYNCLDSSKEYTVNGNNNVPASAQVTEKYFGCDASGCNGERTYTISTAKWVKKEKVIEANYEPRTNFSTYTQYGTIQKDVTTGQYTLYTPLPNNVYPISLMTETGVFPFTIKFNNIGQSNSNSSNLGRLIGENYGGDILSAYNSLRSEDKCNIAGQKDSSYQSATTQSGYVCHYINNCDNCRIECEDGECSFDDKCDGECTYTCENCLFDGSSTNYTFKIISLNNLFPNDRPIGYNWDSNLKATTTTNAIQEDGESIYQKAQYSYTLTPQSIVKIRDYNKKAGSYTNTYVPSEYETISVDSNNSNEAVYCERYEGTGANGQLYNVKCRSKFLDILDALEGSGRAMASDITRVTRDSDAWEFFSCPNGYGIGECKNIGPSWRIRSVD